MATDIKNASSKAVIGGIALLAATAGIIVLATRSRASSIIQGDVNGDGVVDVVDLMLATRISQSLNDPSSNEPYPADWFQRADVDGNGSVDANDLLAIEDIILGIY